MFKHWSNVQSIGAGMEAAIANDREREGEWADLVRACPANLRKHAGLAIGH